MVQPPRAGIAHVRVDAEIPAALPGGLLLIKCLERAAQSVPSGGGIDVRYDVSFHADCRCNQALRTLTGGELAEGDKGTERFCVIVRYADKTQSLWDLAKEYRTSEEAVAGANGITSGEAEQGTLLLIPV